MDALAVPVYLPLQDAVGLKDVISGDYGLQVLFRFLGLARGQEAQVTKVYAVKGDRSAHDVPGGP